MVTKVTVARGLTAGYLTLKYLKEMNENYEKGDWAEAAKDTGWYALTMAPVVAPNFFFGSVAFPVTVGIGIGIVSTAVILETTGLGEWEDAVDLLLDPPSPVRWYQTVAPEVKREVDEALLSAATRYVGWMDRRIEEAKFVWSITAPRSVLPF